MKTKKYVNILLWIITTAMGIILWDIPSVFVQFVQYIKMLFNSIGFSLVYVIAILLATWLTEKKLRKETILYYQKSVGYSIIIMISVKVSYHFLRGLIEQGVYMKLQSSVFQMKEVLLFGICFLGIFLLLEFLLLLVMVYLIQKSSSSEVEGKTEAVSKKALICYGVLFLVAILYWLTAFLLQRKDIYFRAVIQYIAVLYSAFVLPIGLFYLIGFWNKKEKKSFCKLFMKICIILNIALGTVFLWNYQSVLFEKETLIANKLIQGKGKEMNYYQLVSLAWKKKVDDTKIVIKLSLERKYQEEFEIQEDKMYGTDLQIYRVTPKRNNKMVFFAKNDIYKETIVEDYPARRAYARMEEYYKANDFTMPYESYYEDALLEGMKIVCTNKNKAKEYAIEIAKMIRYALEDEFFSEIGNQAKIILICESDYGDMTKEFEFGMDKKYAEIDVVYQEIQRIYEQYTVAEPEIIASEQELQTPEEAYISLYNAIYAKTDEVYQPSYNAKANFYAYLSEGEEIVEGEAMTTINTVVYDRESKNKKCQIFVAYKTYLREDGTEYTTKIENFYAIDRLTKKVVIGDKYAWEDVGSKAYREATGE